MAGPDRPAKPARPSKRRPGQRQPGTAAAGASPPRAGDGKRAIGHGWLLGRRAFSPYATLAEHPRCRCSRPRWFLWALAIVVPIALVTLPAVRGQQGLPGIPAGWPVVAAWLAILAECVLVFVLVGWHVNRTPLGVSVTQRNVASFAQLQALLWLALLVSGVLALLLLGFGRQGMERSPLDLDAVAVLQVGVAGATLVGGAVVLGSKANHTPDAKRLDRTTDRLLQHPDDRFAFTQEIVAARLSGDAPRPLDTATAPRRAAGDAGLARGSRRQERNQLRQATVALERWQGRVDARTREALDALDLTDDRGLPPPVRTLFELPTGASAGDLRNLLRSHIRDQVGGEVAYRNVCPCEARLSDMVEGDEIANARSLDPGKLQFLAASLLGLFVYAASLWGSFAAIEHLASGGTVGEYPIEMVDLLGLSGAAYAGHKLPTRTPLKDVR